MHILSLVTRQQPFLNDSAEGRRMTAEIISRSISTKVWDRAGIELAIPGSAVSCASVARYVTDCPTRPCERIHSNCLSLKNDFFITTTAGFYTKLNVWGSLGLNFEYDGGPIIEIGGPVFLYKLQILEGSTSFCEGSVSSTGQ